jgi:hypothetical protein
MKKIQAEKILVSWAKQWCHKQWCQIQSFRFLTWNLFCCKTLLLPCVLFIKNVQVITYFAKLDGLRCACEVIGDLYGAHELHRLILNLKTQFQAINSEFQLIKGKIHLHYSSYNYFYKFVSLGGMNNKRHSYATANSLLL